MMETSRRKLLCLKCLATGKYLYDEPKANFWMTEKMFRSLTAGFTYRSSGTAQAPQIFCNRCRVEVVLLPTEQTSPDADRPPKAE